MVSKSNLPYNYYEIAELAERLALPVHFIQEEVAAGHLKPALRLYEVDLYNAVDVYRWSMRRATSFKIAQAELQAYLDEVSSQAG
jgi:hypothetical protein